MTKPSPERPGLLFHNGDTVPDDADTGYATGCLFQKSDGGAETALYINEGDEDSCDFNAVVPAGSAELADLADVGATAYTAGSILVGDGDTYEERAISGDATLNGTGVLSVTSVNGVTAGSSTASKAAILDANETFRFGDFATGGASTGAIVAAAGLDKYTDGQLDVLSVFMASTSDLTSAYSAKGGRFRHVVTTAAGSVAHETYGSASQLVVKGTTLTHLHAGLLGTFEGHTSGVVANPAYTYGCGAIIARVGGGAAITATKDVCGVIAFLNGAGMASGDCDAFAVGDQGTAEWTNGVAVERCTNLLKLPAAGTNPVIANALVPAAAPDAGTVGADACLRVLVNGTPYYIPLYDTLHA
jgi:hypothetical protein